MIRFIVETVSSKPDGYGNRYHFADIVSTITGQSLRCTTGGESNGRALVMKTGARFDELHNTVCDGVPLRQWNHAAKFVTLHEHQVTPEMIVALEYSDRNRSAPA